MQSLSLPYSFRVILAALVLASALIWSGCGHGNAPAAPSSSANPQATTTPAASGGDSASAAPAPTPAAAPAPAPPQPVPVTVSAGAFVPVRIDRTLTTRSATGGETFTGTLYAPLLGKNGAVAFPKGTAVSGSVIESKNRGHFKGAGILALELRQIGGQQVTTEEFAITAKGKGKRSAGLIAGGAGGGAVIGALAGGGTGALIGGLIGGGAGTAGAGLTGNKPIVIPAETKLRFRLAAPVSVAVPQ